MQPRKKAQSNAEEYAPALRAAVVRSTIDLETGGHPTAYFGFNTTVPTTTDAGAGPNDPTFAEADAA